MSLPTGRMARRRTDGVPQSSARHPVLAVRIGQTIHLLLANLTPQSNAWLSRHPGGKLTARSLDDRSARGDAPPGTLRSIRNQTPPEGQLTLSSLDLYAMLTKPAAIGEKMETTRHRSRPSRAARPKETVNRNCSRSSSDLSKEGCLNYDLHQSLTTKPGSAFYEN